MMSRTTLLALTAANLFTLTSTAPLPSPMYNHSIPYTTLQRSRSTMLTNTTTFLAAQASPSPTGPLSPEEEKPDMKAFWIIFGVVFAICTPLVIWILVHMGVFNCIFGSTPKPVYGTAAFNELLRPGGKVAPGSKLNAPVEMRDLERAEESGKGVVKGKGIEKKMDEKEREGEAGPSNPATRPSHTDSRDSWESDSTLRDAHLHDTFDPPASAGLTADDIDKTDVKE